MEKQLTNNNTEKVTSNNVVNVSQEQETQNNVEDDSLSFDLSSLFTNNNYSQSTLSIPCYYHPNSPNNVNAKEQQNIDVTIQHSTSASTDYDLTGQIIWPVSLLLSYYLASSQGQMALKQKNVVELGAGCGVPGILAGNFANQVVITDGNDVVTENLLQPNVELYKGKNISCQKLVWGNSSEITNLLERISTVDVIIAADVVQWQAVIEPLLHTMKVLLWASSSKNPMCIIGIVLRNDSVYNMFFTHANSMGFEVTKIEYDDFLEDGIVPEGCREYGGRRTEIYTLHLKVDRSSSIPLNKDCEDDLIVGKEYQHTYSLPC